MAEFGIKNNDFLLTRLSLFFISRGLHLYISFDVIDLLHTITHEQINMKKAIDISKAMESIWKYAQK